MHGICSFSDLAQPLVARLCAQLGYPANSVEAVACARNKDLTRLALAAAGVPTPAHMLITAPGQLGDAAAAVGFPSVLKPVGGSESIGVVRVDSPEQLAESYEKLQALLRATAYKDGSLSTFEDETDTEGSVSAGLLCCVLCLCCACAACWIWAGLCCVLHASPGRRRRWGSSRGATTMGPRQRHRCAQPLPTPRARSCLPRTLPTSLYPLQANAALEFFTDLMLEQYLDGPEVDVDIVMGLGGEVVYANVVDNWPTHEPWFQVRRGRWVGWARAGIRPLACRRTLPDLHQESPPLASGPVLRCGCLASCPCSCGSLLLLRAIHRRLGPMCPARCRRRSRRS